MKSIYLIWKPSYSPQMLASSLPTACISAQQEPAKSHRSSLTLWSAEHVFVLIFLWFDSLGAPSPPPRGSPACLLTRKKHWHLQSVHLIRLKLSFYFQILDLWPTLQVLFGVGLCLFFFFNLLKAQTNQTVIWPMMCFSVNSPGTHSRKC